jgi:MraZ protein
MNYKLFLSTYLNKIDKKSRVSIPSQFREILSQSGSSSVVIFKSISKQCLEAASIEYISMLNDAIGKLDPFSEAKDAFATSIFSESVVLEFDKDGRMIIPKIYIDYTKIDENALFVGKGQTFEIWDPVGFEVYSSKCKEFSLKNRESLKW